MSSFFGTTMSASLEERRRARLEKMKTRMREQAIKLEKETKKKQTGFFIKPKVEGK